jgi:hypothetical protein
MIGKVEHPERVLNTHYQQPPELNAVELMSCGKTDEASSHSSKVSGPLRSRVSRLSGPPARSPCRRVRTTDGYASPLARERQ